MKLRLNFYDGIIIENESWIAFNIELVIRNVFELEVGIEVNLKWLELKLEFGTEICN